jgi:XTP/dITP diphosphohydrolase
VSAAAAAEQRGEGVLQLVTIMDQLRSPGGCPWDAQQTHESLAEYLLEETYETLAAIEHGTTADLVEELGDLLLQVVFHARLGQEAVPSWGIDEVAHGIAGKLIRRHPHVFGDGAQPDGAAGFQARTGTGDAKSGDLDQLAMDWNAAKAQEKGRTSVLDGIPRSMPALAQAQKTWRRATESGVILPQPEPSAQPRSRQELGDLLFALVVAAEESGLDAEAALRDSIEETRRQIRAVEELTDPALDFHGDSG